MMIVSVRYLPDVGSDPMRGAIREAGNVIGIVTRKRGWDGWVKVVEDVAAM